MAADTITTPVRQVLLVAMTTLTCVTANRDYLYYTSPGGAPYGQLPGLYGAAANWRLNASALDYPDSGYQCVTNSQGELLRGLHTMRSLSMDPRTRRVLMNVWTEDPKFTLVTADLCTAEEGCWENATFTPEWRFSEAQLEFKAGPFAYYGDNIYFIYLQEEDAGNGGRKQTIELRMFSGCEDQYPVETWAAFETDDCSKKIAVLEEVPFEIVSPVRVSDTLYAVHNGGALLFLILLQRGIYNEHSMAIGCKMELVLIRSSTGEVTTLHTQDLNVKFLRYSTFHLGAISMKNNKLCWSAVDSILCADWSSAGSISNVQVVLPKGRASDACINAGQAFTAQITTGIAIAHTETEMAIFFGCIAQRVGYGGAGLVRMSGGQSSVFPLQVNDTEIFAGNMFLINHCRPEKNEPGVGGGGGNGGYDYVSDTAAISKSTLGIFALLASARWMLQP